LIVPPLKSKRGGSIIIFNKQTSEIVSNPTFIMPSIPYIPLLNCILKYPTSNIDAFSIDFHMVSTMPLKETQLLSLLLRTKGVNLFIGLVSDEILILFTL